MSDRNKSQSVKICQKPKKKYWKLAHVCHLCKVNFFTNPLLSFGGIKVNCCIRYCRMNKTTSKSKNKWTLLFVWPNFVLFKHKHLDSKYTKLENEMREIKRRVTIYFICAARPITFFLHFFRLSPISFQSSSHYPFGDNLVSTKRLNEHDPEEIMMGSSVLYVSKVCNDLELNFWERVQEDTKRVALLSYPTLFNSHMHLELFILNYLDIKYER